MMFRRRVARRGRPSRDTLDAHLRALLVEMEATPKVALLLSPKAALFLAGVAAHLNEAKVLPDDPTASRESAGWLEEIAYEARRATAVHAQPLLQDGAEDDGA